MTTADIHTIGLTQISPPNTQSSSYRANIIFVHGLQGHPRGTWEARRTVPLSHEVQEQPGPRRKLRSIFRHKSPLKATSSESNSPDTARSVFWPADFLNHDLSDARLWTYGYNANVAGMFEAKNKNSVSQHAQDLSVQLEREIDNDDPMIFLAHSFGGIVVKDALHRSQKIRLRTRFIVFLGTPHRGSDVAAWGTIASNLAKLAFQDSNQRLLDSLRVNGEVFDNIQDEFQRAVLAGSFQVHSFQEARGISGIKGLSGKVVDDFSSKLGLGQPFETVESIDADHMHMVRCETKSDSQYRAILGVLRQCLRNLSDPNYPKGTTSRAIKDTEAGGFQPSYHIQLAKNTNFVGRTAVLDELEEKLLKGECCQTIALAALGGVGKTQVALQFAYHVKEQYPDRSVFWVAALSIGSFEQAYTEIAVKLGLEKASSDDDVDFKQTLCRHLNSEEAGKWLLVIDNADDADVVFGSAGKPGIVEYLPSSKSGLTLLTTRSREVAVNIAQTNIIDLEKMDAEEATQFLRSSVIQKEALVDKRLVEKLLSILAYLPLAIAQAAAYLNQTKIPVTKYLLLLERSESDMTALLSKEFRDKNRYSGSHNAVARTWLVSFDQIQKADEVAVKLLSFLSCIEPKAIPQSILPKPQSLETESAIGILCGYSFLTRRSDSDTFDMHSLVHMAARVWTDEQGRKRLAVEEAVCHLAEIFPPSAWSYQQLWREFLPHAFRLLDRSTGYVVEDRYSLAEGVANCLRVDRRFKEAIRYYEEVFHWCQEHLTEDDSSRLASEHNLATIYLENRRILDAIRILEHIVAIQKTRDAEDFGRLFSEQELGRAYLDDRRIKDAIKIFERVLAVYMKRLDEKDHDRLVTEHNLASAYLEDRRIKDAITMFEHVVAVQKKTLDEENYARLASEHELGRAYLEDRRIKDAIAIYEHVVAVQEKTLGEEDYARLVSEHELGRAYLDDRRIKDAMKILEHVVAVRRNTMDEEDYERLTSEHVLARIYLEDRRIRDAIEIMEHVVAVKKKTLNEEDHERLVSEHELASGYLQDRRIKDAIKVLEHVVAVRKKTLEDEDFERIASALDLGRAYLEDRRIEDAVQILEHAVTVRKKTLDEEDYERLVAEHELARAYLNCRRIRDAIEIFEHVVAMKKKTLDEEDYERLLSEHMLASAYLEDRRVEGATIMLEHVVALQRKTLDEEDHERLSSVHDLGRAYLANGRIKDAMKLLENVVTVRKKTLDEEDHERLSSEYELARVYLEDQRVLDAIQILEHVVAVRKKTLDEGDYARLVTEQALAGAYSNISYSKGN